LQVLEAMKAVTLRTKQVLKLQLDQLDRHVHSVHFFLYSSESKPLTTFNGARFRLASHPDTKMAGGHGGAKATAASTDGASAASVAAVNALGHILVEEHGGPVTRPEKKQRRDYGEKMDLETERRKSVQLEEQKLKDKSKKKKHHKSAEEEWLTGYTTGASRWDKLANRCFLSYTAVLACSLERRDGGWVVNEDWKPAEGRQGSYEQMVALVKKGVLGGGWRTHFNLAEKRRANAFRWGFRWVPGKLKPGTKPLRKGDTQTEKERLLAQVMASREEATTLAKAKHKAAADPDCVGFSFLVEKQGGEVDFLQDPASENVKVKVLYSYLGKAKLWRPGWVTCFDNQWNTACDEEWFPKGYVEKVSKRGGNRGTPSRRRQKEQEEEEARKKAEEEKKRKALRSGGGRRGSAAAEQPPEPETEPPLVNLTKEKVVAQIKRWHSVIKPPVPHPGFRIHFGAGETAGADAVLALGAGAGHVRGVDGLYTWFCLRKNGQWVFRNCDSANDLFLYFVPGLSPEEIEHHAVAGTLGEQQAANDNEDGEEAPGVGSWVVAGSLEDGCMPIVFVAVDPTTAAAAGTAAEAAAEDNIFVEDLKDGVTEGTPTEGTAGTAAKATEALTVVTGMPVAAPPAGAFGMKAIIQPYEADKAGWKHRDMVRQEWVHTKGLQCQMEVLEIDQS
jgi:hypothetical protein